MGLLEHFRTNLKIGSTARGHIGDYYLLILVVFCLVMISL